MTSKNTSLRTECTAVPCLLKPIGKDYLWGGNRLNDDFAKEINMNPLAETWECSVHPDGMSVIASGVYKGISLKELLEQNPEFLGTHAAPDYQLPILIKLIDAKQNLSVQVHPDDEYARENENGESGKSEMWYVLDAHKNTEIVYGFRNELTKEELKDSLVKGNVEKHLQKVKIKKDDVFYVEAGTIHGIGEGALIAEIQENSNLTYRLFDYNRVDRNGQRRELHIEKGLAVINRKVENEPRQPLRVLKYKPGCALELLCRCKHFQVERFLVNTERNRSRVIFQTQKDSFEVLLCISGCGTLNWNKTEYLNIFKGDCIFVPADSVDIKIHGRVQMLKISC